MNQSKPPAPLGHGDHWLALGLQGDALVSFVQTVTQRGGVTAKFPPPWPGSEFVELAQIELRQASLVFVSPA